MSLLSKAAVFFRNSSKPTLRYFDEAYYLKQYPHVSDHASSPLEHYLLVGWEQRYDPSAEFSTSGYLTANPDVAAIEVNPLLHYLRHGAAEGRTGWEKVAAKSYAASDEGASLNPAS